MKYLVIISSGKLKQAFNLLIQVDGSGANKNCLEDLEMNKNITDKLKSKFINLRIHSLEKNWVRKDRLEKARVKLGGTFRLGR